MSTTVDVPEVAPRDPNPDRPVSQPARGGLSASFHRLWAAAALSGAGDGIRIGVLPLLAAALTSDPRAVALVWFAGGLPFLLVGPVSGVLVDRWRDRRRIMWTADVVAALVVGLFAIVVAAGGATVAALVVLNILLGSVQTLRDSAELAAVPRLVDRAALDAANSRLQGVRLLTIDLLGPPIAALLFALPAGTPFLLDAVTFVVAAVLVRGIVAVRSAAVTPDQAIATGGAAPARSGVFAELRAGLRWLWAHRLLRTLCVLVGLTNLAVMTAMSIAVLYAFQVLHVSRVEYGLLLGVVALGGVLGSIAAPALGRRLGRGGALRLAFGLSPIAFLIAGLTSAPLVAAAALAGVGATVGISGVIAVSLRQLLVHDGVVGRVNASYRFVAAGLAPVGALLGGFTAEEFGLRAPFVVAALILAIAWLVTFPTLANRAVTPHPGGDAGDDTDTRDDTDDNTDDDAGDDAGDDGDAGGPGAPAPVRRPGRWRRVARRTFVSAIVVVMVLATAVAGTVSWTVRRSFPVVDGRIAIGGLHGPVEVVRDASGVPQIYADDPHDLFLAQGYVHAQDRFWEMDVRRHITAGRLAELFGPGLVPTDAVVRTLGWRSVAERELGLLDPATRAALDAYSAGVNAYLAGHSGAALGVEYAILALAGPQQAPQPWSAADSVSWLKAMAWDLRSNMGDEVQRALMLAHLPTAMVDELYPAYDFASQRPIVAAGERIGAGDPANGTAGPRAVPAAPASAPASTRAVAGSVAALGRLSAVLGSGGAGVGSNSWVVSGAHTVTGKPMLANDPHLGPSLPGIWYQIGLHCRQVGPACPYDLSGFGFSGMPAVIIGHNADIAWGLTNLGADVTDLFIEKVRGDEYEYQGGWLPLATHDERIEVAGGPPTTITVRATRHGPILSDVLDPVGDIARADDVDALALRWTALDPGRTMDAVLEFGRATDWSSFRAAAAHFSVPAQNLVYADRAGHIGYQAPGLIPIRAAGDGRLPVPGWTGQYEWTGYIPFAELPTVYDPPSGLIVTANNAVVGSGYPYLITSDWSDGLRSERITDLLGSAGPLDADAMSRIQLDDRNPFAATLVPYLLAVRPGARAAAAQDLLRSWDGGQPTGSAAAAYFNAVWRHLLRLTFTDELSDTAADPDPDGGGRWFEAVGGLLRRPDDAWWRNAKDPRGLHDRDQVLAAAMDDAAAELGERLGDNPADWRWGALHTLTLTNQTLGVGAPPPVQWLLNRGPYEMPGGNDAVNATGWDARDGYAVDWGPSMRMVVDFGYLDQSRWINQTGASGHAYADSYVDQASLWAAGSTVRWPHTAAAVDSGARHRLTLVPASGS